MGARSAPCSIRRAVGASERHNLRRMGVPASAAAELHPHATGETVPELVRRAREAQRIYDQSDQQQVDETVAAAGWAIMHPERNRALAEMAVRDTGLGDVDDKVQKNYRKTLGLLRDLKGAR